MSDDQDGCEWVSVSSGTGLPELSRTKAVKRLCACVCVCVRVIKSLQDPLEVGKNLPGINDR